MTNSDTRRLAAFISGGLIVSSLLFGMIEITSRILTVAIMMPGLMLFLDEVLCGNPLSYYFMASRKFTRTRVEELYFDRRAAFRRYWIVAALSLLFFILTNLFYSEFATKILFIFCFGGYSIISGVALFLCIRAAAREASSQTRKNSDA